ncbi:hypothetical protein VTL71DRAFT_9959 [Oculimacula yallundae]|uniref:Uncharacterized protein n=1 Tax=Oculimacula yallundae TaxID=86028 RepID=A0ABR4BRY9_9HELO
MSYTPPIPKHPRVIQLEVEQSHVPTMSSINTPPHSPISSNPFGTSGSSCDCGSPLGDIVVGIGLGIIIFSVAFALVTGLVISWEKSCSYQKQYKAYLGTVARSMRLTKELGEEAEKKFAEKSEGETLFRDDDNPLKGIKRDLYFLVDNLEYITEEGYVAGMTAEERDEVNVEDPHWLKTKPAKTKSETHAADRLWVKIRRRRKEKDDVVTV